MAKCIRCGKSGFFVKVNASGICDDCFRKAAEQMDRRKQFDDVDKRFQRIQKQHGDLSAKIRSMHNKAIQGKDTKITNDCVKLCEKDIALAPEYLRLYREHQRAGQTTYGWNNDAPYYGAFETLAFIRHHQGNGEEAIRLCQQHIDMGFGRPDTMRKWIELFKTPYVPKTRKSKE